MKYLVLNTRQLNELELLLDGSYYPLEGYMNSKDYYSCLYNMRLDSGLLWALPVTLSVPDNTYNVGDIVVLKDETNLPIAELYVEEIYQPNVMDELKYSLDTMDSNHPYHHIIMENQNKSYLGGKVKRIDDRLPIHYDFKDLRMTPADTKKYFKDNGWTKIIGFQTRNPMHRSHYNLTLNSMMQVGDDCKLLLHPVVGITQDCDIEYHARVRCYKKIIDRYPPNSVLLSLLPLNMRMAGPREALHHAIIRKNYGCTHFIVGRDHAGPSYKTKAGDNFYGPYDAHKLLKRYEDELGIVIVLSQNIVYVKELDQFMEESLVPKDMKCCNLSGTEQRNMLANNIIVPSWYSWDNIMEELRKEYKLQQKKGLCIYLIGLSGSGKSTLANHLIEKIKETESERQISLLDGDVVRQQLCKGLGFSKEDRSTNVRRIGYVATEIVRHGGIVICSNIAPYDNDRLYNRKQISQYGQYVEVWVDTPIECCEKRDVKGLYRMARAGILQGMTGIDDPFEIPSRYDIRINGDDSIENNIDIIMNKL